MIELTKMNNEKFYLNPNIIEEIEITPDRLITTLSGKKYYVQETVDEIRLKADEYYQRISANRRRKK